MLQCCVCLSFVYDVCTCIVTKRCVLGQKLLLTAYRKSYNEKSIGTVINDLVLCLKVVSRSCQPLRYIRRWISRKPLEKWAWLQRPPIGNGLRGIKWSHDRWRHVTPKGQNRDPNTLTAQYLENIWRCYIGIANYYLVCCEEVRSAILATAWLLVKLPQTRSTAVNFKYTVSQNKLGHF